MLGMTAVSLRDDADLRVVTRVDHYLTRTYFFCNNLIWIRTPPLNGPNLFKTPKNLIKSERRAWSVTALHTSGGHACRDKGLFRHIWILSLWKAGILFVYSMFSLSNLYLEILYLKNVSAIGEHLSDHPLTLMLSCQLTFLKTFSKRPKIEGNFKALFWR